MSTTPNQFDNPYVHSEPKRRGRLFAAHDLPTGRSICALVLAAGLASPASAIDRSWVAGSGSFQSPVHWAPLGVPGPADIAQAGNVSGIENFTLFSHANVSVMGLTLTNGMGYQNEGWHTSVSGLTFLNTGARIYLNNAVFGTDFVTGSLLLSGVNSRIIVDQATLRVNQTTTIGQGSSMTLWGGEWRSGGAGTTLVNNGRINTSNGINVTSLNSLIMQEGGGRYDLDGTNNQGEVSVGGTTATVLTIHGQGLTDPFTGLITIGPFATFETVLLEGWELGQGGTIRNFGSLGSSEDPSTLHLTAGALDLNGHVEVLNFGFPSYLSISGAVNIGSTATADVRVQCVLRFNGPTTVSGGVFQTHSGNVEDGSVRFHGNTNWRGTTVFDGAARQIGTATVNTPTGATIHATTLDMDGINGTTTWNVQASLNVNADRINETAEQTFDGTINIGSGFTSRLIMNLTGDTPEWIMRGTLNLVGTSPFATPRVAGSPMIISGDVNLASGRAQINADTTFSGSLLSGVATTTIGPAAADLLLGGSSRIEAGAVFIGAGRVGAAIGGTLRLDDGVNLGGVGLYNAGTVVLGGPGLVAADRFEQVAGAVMHINIAGYEPGSTHDLISVSGGEAFVAGTLRINLDPTETIPFKPQVGDAFTVLTALNGVNGEFDLVPPSIAGGKKFDWEVEMQPNAIIARVAGVSELPACPADLDGNGLHDLGDIMHFLGLFTSGDPAADLNYDGILDFADVLAFLASFDAGCGGG